MLYIGLLLVINNGLLVQWGNSVGVSRGQKTILFPIIYLHIPVVLTTNAAAESSGTANVSHITTSSFIEHVLFDRIYYGDPFNWLAIG